MVSLTTGNCLAPWEDNRFALPAPPPTSIFEPPSKFGLDGDGDYRTYMSYGWLCLRDGLLVRLHFHISCYNSGEWRATGELVLPYRGQKSLTGVKRMPCELGNTLGSLRGTADIFTTFSYRSRKQTKLLVSITGET